MAHARLGGPDRPTPRHARRVRARAARAAQIASRLHLVPQFRWKLVEVPFGLDRPVWIEDPDFDIDYHVRRIGVPPPGGPEQLGNLIGDLVGLQARPQPAALGDLGHRRAGATARSRILAKIHHSIIDGVSGSELATVLFDLEPDPDRARADDPPPGEIDSVPIVGRAGGPGRRPHAAPTPYRTAPASPTRRVRQGLSFIGFQRRPSSPSDRRFQAPAHLVQRRAHPAPPLRLHQRVARRGPRRSRTRSA